jgi:hypothetical protein
MNDKINWLVSCLLVMLLVGTECAALIAQEQTHADIVRNQIITLAAKGVTPIDVRLRDGTQLSGYVSNISPDRFSLLVRKNRLQREAYLEIYYEQVTAATSHKRAVVIVVVVTAAAVTIWLLKNCLFLC